MSEEIIQTFYFEKLFKNDEPILEISVPEDLLMEIKIRRSSNRVVFNILKDDQHFNELSDVILSEGNNRFVFIVQDDGINLVKIGDFEVMYVFPVNAKFKFYNFKTNKWEKKDDNNI
jgi:hypothetical protein